jgi:hypothetical protein
MGVTATTLDEGRRLVREGRFLDAIGPLTRANREHPDPKLERELVNLRHRGFDQVATTSGLEEWPRRTPDRFAEGAIPVVPAAELDSEVLASGIVNHGSVIVRGLFAPATAAQLRDDIDRAFAGGEAWDGGAKASETLPWFARFKPGPDYTLGKAGNWVRRGGGLYAVESPRTVFHLLDAVEQSGLGRVIEAYLGERPALSVKKWTLRRVPVDSGTNWHQDGAFLGPVRTVNLWVALSPCGVDAPSVDIVPRRLHEILETGTEGAMFDWSVGPAVVDRAADGIPIERPVFEPGDALLFDEFNLHRTGVSPEMTKVRYAIESWFFAPSLYPDAQIPLAY